MTRRTTRRQFLTGRPAPTGNDDRLAPVALEVTAGKPYLVHVSRPAMACQFEVCFDARQYPNAMQAAIDALDLVDMLEGQLSFFRATSQISRLNLVAADGPVEIESHLFDLLELALKLYEETDGAFDVTSTPLWEAWGFARREGALPSPETLADAMQRVGSRHVELDRQRRTVRFTRPGIRLNLGSIGKGYALDRAAEVLARSGIRDFLFHAGQSSILARGSGGAGPRPGWTVGVRHPLRPKQRLAEIRFCDRALGTSGSTMQYFRHRGRRFAHILDPRTGRPAEGVLCATVVAPTAALADGLSTALFVMGPQMAREYCRRRPEVAALLVCPADQAGEAEIHAMGFGPDELTLLDGT